jgi:protein-tyrosine phosphatase
MTWIDLEGAVNVRDLGGLPTEDGQQTAYGRLLRSDNLQNLSPSDVAILVEDIGVTTVVDLRSPGELETEGLAPLDEVPSVRHVHHPVLPEIGSRTDAIAEALLVTKVERDRARYPEDITCGHYLGYLEDRPEEVTGALRTIASSDGAAIVHCAAGKDRTGVICAMALTVAGVRPEAVVADYAASASRIEAIVGRLRKSRTYAQDVGGKPVTAHTPRPETMEAFLRQLDARYGGIARWLDGHGFGDDEFSKLRARLRQD